MSEFVLEMKDVYKAFPGVIALRLVEAYNLASCLIVETA